MTPRSGLGRGLSARARIVGMTVVVVALALAVTVMALRQVLLTERADFVDRSLEQEARDFTELVRSSKQLSSETSDEYARRLLTTFLETNVNSSTRSLLAVQDGIPFLQSPGAIGDVVPFVDQFATVTEPAFFDLDSDAGAVRTLAEPIVGDDGQIGLLAISEFVEEDRSQVEQTVRNAALIAVAALLAAAVLAWIVAGRVLRPIGLLAETARDITEHDLTQRLPVQGADEIASLISSFNAMLDRLESAIGNQRRFLDDASHELRTPITIMRGHLELANDDPRQLLDSRDIVLAELDRMARIVDDLLVLARAEQIDFLRRRPIDTDAFLSSLLDRSRALSTHNWSLDEVAVGVIDADDDRLTQAMLNLAVNAARHTPPGGDIAIGGRFEGDEFALWVRDTGEGIDVTDHERIFDRFTRATADRSGGSAGLGLAIVSAIAQAHGGRVEVESVPGFGATFTITIPVRPLPTGPTEDLDLTGESAAPALPPPEPMKEPAWPGS